MLVIENCNSLSDLRQKLIDGEEVRTRQEPYKVSEYDKDHIWYKGNQYISLRRFLEVKAKAEKEPCEDAISRQAVLDKKELVELEDGQSFYCISPEDVETLPSVTPQSNTGHWIPVSERLPEEYGEYLITWTTSQSKRPFIGISEGEVTNEYDHEHNRFKFEWLLEDYIKAYPNVEVIAWMPLPKPYEPQESED